MRAAVIVGVLFTLFIGGPERAALRVSGSPGLSGPARGGPESAALRVDAQGGLKIDPVTAGTIAGRVIFDGAPPARETLDMSANRYCVSAAGPNLRSDAILIDPAGGLQNVFVYVKSGLDPSYAFDVEVVPAVLDQRFCQFIPRVIGVQVGQPLEIRNGDETLHDVHGHPKKNQQFNHGQPIAGMRLTKTFTSAEVMIPVTSDIHPWMSAFVGVVAHPFFAVTRSDGAFRIGGLPPGGYVIEAWHEVFGTATEQITVDSGQTTTLSFTFRNRERP